MCIACVDIHSTYTHVQIKCIFVDICIYLNLLGWLSLVWELIADPPPINKHLKLASPLGPLLTWAIVVILHATVWFLLPRDTVNAKSQFSFIWQWQPGVTSRIWSTILLFSYTWLNILIAVQGQDLGHSSWKTTHTHHFHNPRGFEETEMMKNSLSIPEPVVKRLPPELWDVFIFLCAVFICNGAGSHC